MKKIYLVAVMTFVMFFIGFLISPLLLDISGSIVNLQFTSIALLGDFMPRISWGILLACCAISAGVILWAYSRNRQLSISTEKRTYAAGLFISLVCALCGVGYKLVQLQGILDPPALQRVVLSAENMDYFSWGIGPLLLVCGAITITILNSPGRQPESENA